MIIRIITIFPDMFTSSLNYGNLKRSMNSGKVEISVHDLRDYTFDKHRTVDDTAFGGGAGMVMKPEPFFNCVETLSKEEEKKPFVILTSPQGRVLDQGLVEQLKEKEIIYILCGRYEGVDNRVSDYLVDEEVSIGDYILSGGEIPAMTIADSITRLIPGVLGSQESVDYDNFSQKFQWKLKGPVYTKPQNFKGLKVPKVLLSGNHKEIEKWRKLQSNKRSSIRRPDLSKG